MRIAFLPVVFLAVSMAHGFAQAPDPLKLLEELDGIQGRREQQKETERKSAIDKVLDAAKSPASASSAYADAYKTVELAGKTGQAAEFEEWRKKNEDLLGSSEFRSAVQFHLRYLALTLQRCASDKPEDFVQPSIEYLKDLAEAEKRISPEGGKKESQAILKESVSSGIFSRAWRLDPFFGKSSDWEMSPGNVEGILEKNIRALYRKAKKPQLLETWDWQLQLEEERNRTIRRRHEKDNFEQLKKPSLLFRRAQDRAALGENVPAALDAMAVLRAHPEHPEFDSWIAKIREWLKTPAQTPAP